MGVQSLSPTAMVPGAIKRARALRRFDVEHAADAWNVRNGRDLEATRSEVRERSLHCCQIVSCRGEF